MCWVIWLRLKRTAQKPVYDQSSYESALNRSNFLRFSFFHRGLPLRVKTCKETIKYSSVLKRCLTSAVSSWLHVLFATFTYLTPISEWIILPVQMIMIWELGFTAKIRTNAMFTSAVRAKMGNVHFVS